MNSSTQTYYDGKTGKWWYWDYGWVMLEIPDDLLKPTIKFRTDERLSSAKNSGSLVAKLKRKLFSCSRRKQDREHRENERHRQIMTALENLTKAITDLTAAVDLVSTKFPIGASEAEVQAAADGVNREVGRLTALVTPPPVP